MHAHVRGAAGEQQVRDALHAQHGLQLGIGEGAVGGLVDDDVGRAHLDLGHDLEVGRATHQPTQCVQVRVPAATAVEPHHVRKVGTVALPGVHDEAAGCARRLDHPVDRGQDGAQRRGIVALPGEIAVRRQERLLQVDAKKRGGAWFDAAIIGPIEGASLDDAASRAGACFPLSILALRGLHALSATASSSPDANRRRCAAGDRRDRRAGCRRRCRCRRADPRRLRWRCAG